MRNLKLILSYDGSEFAGWQVQPDAVTVQGTLASAIGRISGENVLPQGSGRTDAGVHALGQVAHFDLEKMFAGDTLRDALNYHLRPDPVAVLEGQVAASDFHARFSATARLYHYRIVTRRAPLALDRGRAWHIMRNLDADAMHEGARHLVGKHDFTTFRAAECQAQSPVKTLDSLSVRRAGEEIHIEAKARSFLHHQMRSFAGSLKLVGEGKWQPREIAVALKARERARCGPVAPPEGLYLVRIEYES